MTRALIVEQAANPSTDFFILPKLENGDFRCERLLLYDGPPDDGGEIDRVIFVRYITPQWRRWVERNKASLGKVVLFMDDDLLDLKAHSGLPWRYRWKLLQLIWRHQRWLKAFGVELWVSTPWLLEKYQEWQPQLLYPQSPHLSTPAVTTLFYHGSASHYDEIEWLYPVVAEVLERAPELTFEIIGNQKVRKLFANVPRVHVLHSMNWPAYQALLQRPGRTVGLAPLLDSPFNRARSHTKFFDITQAGAVGIYAPGTIYERIVTHGDNGLLVPMDKAAWVEAILQLAGDEVYRARLLQGARNSL
ncbi:glycosyltransferase [Marinobacterium rhizophilum]|uniref:glycosyltransferase n=1 Tax=Marinobacterium rhizophilum TaxID=420402 RepID=UPI00036537BD|nr:glycosyltransferase [Marinobacterium rhizophilum]